MQGNPLLDFTEGGQYNSDVMNINTVSTETYHTPSGDIDFNPSLGIDVLDSDGSVLGSLSPDVVLFHEIGHHWLDVVNNPLSNRMSSQFNVTSGQARMGGRSTSNKYGDSVEHDIIMSKVEIPYARARGQIERMTYRTLLFEISPDARTGRVNQDLWRTTKGSTSND